jgi:aspartyl-tRNA(Asn)/glutamyl-tRNA(Gln) amidotransferase subunit C
MAQLSPEDITKLAHLARLDLTATEIDEYVIELSKILRYVEMLQSVDVTGLKPTNQVTGLVNVTRTDQIKEYGYTARDLLANVPQLSEDNQIQVKRMLG